MNYYCWNCYAVNTQPNGVCVECGGQIAAPAGMSCVELLLWELGHPLPDRQLTVASILAKTQPTSNPTEDDD